MGTLARSTLRRVRELSADRICLAPSRLVRLVGENRLVEQRARMDEHAWGLLGTRHTCRSRSTGLSPHPTGHVLATSAGSSCAISSRKVIATRCRTTGAPHASSSPSAGPVSSGDRRMERRCLTAEDAGVAASVRRRSYSTPSHVAATARRNAAVARSAFPSPPRVGRRRRRGRPGARSGPPHEDLLTHATKERQGDRHRQYRIPRPQHPRLVEGLARWVDPHPQPHFPQDRSYVDDRRGTALLNRHGAICGCGSGTSVAES